MELVPDLLDQIVKLFRLFNKRGFFYVGEDLTFPDVRVLDYLSEVGKCNMTEIVSNLKLAASSATGFVDRLVKYDYVSRQHSEEDRRQVLLEITTQGRKIQEKIRSESAKQLKILLKDFTQDEIIQLISLMQKINEKAYSIIENI